MAAYGDLRIPEPALIFDFFKQRDDPFKAEKFETGLGIESRCPKQCPHKKTVPSGRNVTRESRQPERIMPVCDHHIRLSGNQAL
ncbi:hypothetical protein A3J34_01170 [Candidatus Peribacteria bacterium RIFCSPLOWO2_02_FULL_51_10]|nr:MAG: hypothetical protein A3J34_01170 [Candidatus Peribacteria bacterium RIFCSPLOWO2_02_FULL_51_10]